jgi:hypothetical protein
MATYSSLDDAFNNNDVMELDKLANEFNNNKKKKLAKEVQEDINRDIDNGKKTINRMVNSSNPAFQYFSTQGGVEAANAETYDRDIYSLDDKKNNYGVSLSESSDDLHTFRDSINDTRKESPNVNDKDRTIYNKQNKYHEKLKNLADSIKYINHDDESSASSNSIEDTINHIKNCEKCKKKLKHMLKNKKEMHLFDDEHIDHFSPERKMTYQKPVNNIRYDDYNENGSQSFFSRVNMRDIILLVLIIVVVILIIDMMIKK